MMKAFVDCEPRRELGEGRPKADICKYIGSSVKVLEIKTLFSLEMEV